MTKKTKELWENCKQYGKYSIRRTSNNEPMFIYAYKFHHLFLRDKIYLGSFKSKKEVEIYLMGYNNGIEHSQL